MPRPNDPNARDFYVYVFHANDYPFYVGHGRADRLRDRPVYIDRLVRLHPNRAYHRWKRHMEVVANLWQAGVQVYFDQLTSDQTKAEATAQEGELLKKLIKEEFLMSNEAGNPGVQLPQTIVAAILAGTKQWADLANFTPVRRYIRP